jgi:hypothetical protein
MPQLVKAVAVSLVAGACVATANATPIYAWAARSAPFSSTSNQVKQLPLTDGGATTMQFSTAKPGQVVKIVYNTECVVVGERGTTLHLRILVDDVEASPAGKDFILCSAVDTGGSSWAPVVRQSVLKVADAGTHSVKVLAQLVPVAGGSGSWRLDDSSTVVSGGLILGAARTKTYGGSTSQTQKIPLNNVDATDLTLTTTTAHELVALTFNAECVVASDANGRTFEIHPVVEGGTSPEAFYSYLCNAHDSLGQTWEGAARQSVIAIAQAGDHGLYSNGRLNQSPGVWQIDDSSLVAEKGVRAVAYRGTTFSGSSASEVAIPLNDNGAKVLHFTTAAANATVKVVYGASCTIQGPLGEWASIRLVVDGVEAAPASGSDFAFCSTRNSNLLNFHAGYRQSIAVVPKKGDHTVRIYGKGSAAGVSWGFGDATLLVE